MKRDWDVIREVLIEVEALTEKDRYSFKYGLGSDYASLDPAKSEQALLLWKAGYLEGIDGRTNAGPAVLAPQLTWAGHDLLDTIRSKTVWERVKTKSKESGIELTFDAVKALASAVIAGMLTAG